MHIVFYEMYDEAHLPKISNPIMITHGDDYILLAGRHLNQINGKIRPISGIRCSKKKRFDSLGGRQFSVLSADVRFGKDYIFSSLFSSYITRPRYTSRGAKRNYLTHSGSRDLRLSTNKIPCFTFASIDMESADIVRGACLCGQIIVSVPRNALPKFTGICRCLDCKTVSGPLYV
jgi:hypothetical protein